MATGISFRATAAFITDGPNDTYSLGEAYPVTRGGLTFGWGSNRTANARDRDTSPQDLGGIVFVPNGGATDTFRVDVPAPGNYNLRLALGDAGNIQDNRVLVRDGVGGTVLATIQITSPAAEWADATGVLRTPFSVWHTDNVALAVTLTGTALVLELGGHPSGVTGSAIAKLELTSTATGAELSGNATLDSVAAAGGASSAADLSGNANLDSVAASGGASSAADLSGGATLDSVSAAGGLQGAGAAASLSGNATLDSVGAAGGLSMQPGSITTDPLVRINDVLAPANNALVWVAARRMSDGVPVLLQSGGTLDSSSRVAVTSVQLVQGVSYMLEWLESTGQHGRWVAAAV